MRNLRLHRGHIIAVAALVALAVAPSRADTTEVRQADGVVELFTSQGCNSCPPADRVLSELASNGSILALAWHIDFWDYIGWKDTFGNRKHTERWKSYAGSLGQRSAYTPQAVINGRVDVVGSRGLAVRREVEDRVGTEQGMTVPIDARIADGMLKVRIDAASDAKGATLWMVYFDRNREVKITRGENRGHTLKYSNIVRNMEMIGTVHDQALQTEFALSEIQRRGHDGCALILQHNTEDGLPGPIVGAAFVPDLMF